MIAWGTCVSQPSARSTRLVFFLPFQPFKGLLSRVHNHLLNFQDGSRLSALAARTWSLGRFRGFGFAGSSPCPDERYLMVRTRAVTFLECALNAIKPASQAHGLSSPVLPIRFSSDSRYAAGSLPDQ